MATRARATRLAVVLIAVALVSAGFFLLWDGNTSTASDVSHTSDAPGTSDTPDAPGTSDTPDAPATSDASDSPETSDTSDSPDTSDLSDTSDTPDTSDASADATDDASEDPPTDPSTLAPPDPLASPTPATTGAAVDPAFVADVQVRINTVLDSIAAVEGTSSSVAILDSLDVSGAFRSELEAERLEFAAEGWTREGSYQVLDVEVISAEPSDDPASLLVAACVDTSSLSVRRADGELLADPGTPPATNYFALERDGDDWLIAGRSYPNEPRCDR